MIYKADLRGKLVMQRTEVLAEKNEQNQQWSVYCPTSKTKEKKRAYEIEKRIFDVIFSSLALIVLSPIFLLTAIAIKLQDGGNVFYSQPRVTRGCRLFRMYKFRSMCIDADQKLDKLMDQNEMTGPVFKIKEDPRITKVGKFIRTTSIDELPQLVNVLKGDMSIIGPRPPLPREVEQYTERQLHRLDVKAGLACYHECRGRNLIKDFDQWVEMDLQYIHDRSMWTDIKVVFETIVAVLTRKGAE